MEKIAKDLAFCPMLRVVIPKGTTNGWSEEEFAELTAREKLQSWTKSEIIDWVMDNLEDICESPETFDKDYD